MASPLIGKHDTFKSQHLGYVFNNHFKGQHQSTVT